MPIYYIERDYDVPEHIDVEHMPVGSIVKIGLRDEELGQINGERFWVTITSKRGRYYKATTNCDLEVFDIGRGSEMRFRAEHIMDKWS